MRLSRQAATTTCWKVEVRAPNILRSISFEYVNLCYSLEGISK